MARPLPTQYHDPAWVRERWSYADQVLKDILKEHPMKDQAWNMSVEELNRAFEKVENSMKDEKTGMEILNQHQPGAKLDHGKPRLALVLGGFSDALFAVGEVGTFGAEKYTPNGWRSVPNYRERYLNAALRHIFQDLGGEGKDSESGLPHLAHAAWCLLAVLEMERPQPPEV